MNVSPVDRHRGPVTAGDFVRFAIVAVYLLFVLMLLLGLRRVRLHLSLARMLRKLVRTARLPLAFRGGGA
jgi:hypothetical protein